MNRRSFAKTIYEEIWVKIIIKLFS